MVGFLPSPILKVAFPFKKGQSTQSGSIDASRFNHPDSLSYLCGNPVGTSRAPSAGKQGGIIRDVHLQAVPPPIKVRI